VKAVGESLKERGREKGRGREEERGRER